MKQPRKNQHSVQTNLIPDYPYKPYKRKPRYNKLLLEMDHGGLLSKQ